MKKTHDYVHHYRGWSHLRPEEVGFLVRSRTGERPPPSTVEPPSDDHDASRRFKAFPDRARP